MAARSLDRHESAGVVVAHDVLAAELVGPRRDPAGVVVAGPGLGAVRVDGQQRPAGAVVAPLGDGARGVDARRQLPGRLVGVRREAGRGVVHALHLARGGVGPGRDTARGAGLRLRATRGVVGVGRRGSRRVGDGQRSPGTVVRRPLRLPVALPGGRHAAHGVVGEVRRGVDVVVDEGDQARAVAGVVHGRAGRPDLAAEVAQVVVHEAGHLAVGVGLGQPVAVGVVGHRRPVAERVDRRGPAARGVVLVARHTAGGVGRRRDLAARRVRPRRGLAGGVGASRAGPRRCRCRSRPCRAVGDRGQGALGCPSRRWWSVRRAPSRSTAGPWGSRSHATVSPSGCRSW